jgi:hypothetical protein
MSEKYSVDNRDVFGKSTQEIRLVLASDLGQHTDVIDSKNYLYFGHELTTILDKWDEQRPALLVGRNARDLRLLLDGEIQEVKEAPDDRLEKADVIIFANRLWRVADATFEDKTYALGTMVDYTNQLIEAGYNPFDVCLEKIEINSQNYLMEMLDDACCASAKVRFLKSLRRSFVSGVLPSATQLHTLYESESRPAINIGDSGVWLSMDGQFPSAIMKLFAAEELVDD